MQWLLCIHFFACCVLLSCAGDAQTLPSTLPIADNLVNDPGFELGFGGFVPSQIGASASLIQLGALSGKQSLLISTSTFRDGVVWSKDLSLLPNPRSNMFTISAHLFLPIASGSVLSVCAEAIYANGELRSSCRGIVGTAGDKGIVSVSLPLEDNRDLRQVSFGFYQEGTWPLTGVLIDDVSAILFGFTFPTTIPTTTIPTIPTTIPTLPTIPTTTLPATTFPDLPLPATTFPATTFPATTFPTTPILPTTLPQQGLAQESLTQGGFVSWETEANAPKDASLLISGTPYVPLVSLNISKERPFISLDDFTAAGDRSDAFRRLQSQVDDVVKLSSGLPDTADFGDLKNALNKSHANFSVVDNVILYRLTDDEKYINEGIHMIDLFIDSETQSIQQGGQPKLANQQGGQPNIANGDHAHIGKIEQIALVYDYGFDKLTKEQREAWERYVNQTIINLWHSAQAKLGDTTPSSTLPSSTLPSSTLPSSTLSSSTLPTIPTAIPPINDPSKCLFFDFIKATELWALAIQDQGLIHYLQNQKFSLLVPYYSQLVGGGSRQGTGFGVCLAELFEDYLYWRDSTGEDLCAMSSHCNDTILYWIHATTPTFDTFAPIGDQHSLPQLSDDHRKLMLEAVALNKNSANAQNGQWWLNNAIIGNGQPGSFSEAACYRYDLLKGNKIQGQIPKELFFDASGTGVVFARSGWTKDASWLSFIAGTYDQPHAHQDQGSFAFFKDGWLAVTSNIFSKNGSMQGVENHNILRFESQGQNLQQQLNSVSSRTVNDAGNIITIRADLTPAYAGGVAGQVENWNRELIYDRAQHTLEIHDRCTVANGVNPIFQLHVPDQPQQQNGEISAGRLHIISLLPQNPNVRIVDMTKEQGEFTGGHRIEITGQGCEFHVKLFAEEIAGSLEASIEAVSLEAASLEAASIEAPPEAIIQPPLANATQPTIAIQEPPNLYEASEEAYLTTEPIPQSGQGSLEASVEASRQLLETELNFTEGDYNATEDDYISSGEVALTIVIIEEQEQSGEQVEDLGEGQSEELSEGQSEEQSDVEVVERSGEASQEFVGNNLTTDSGENYLAEDLNIEEDENASGWSRKLQVTSILTPGTQDNDGALSSEEQGLIDEGNFTFEEETNFTSGDDEGNFTFTMRVETVVVVEGSIEASTEMGAEEPYIPLISMPIFTGEESSVELTEDTQKSLALPLENQELNETEEESVAVGSPVVIPLEDEDLFNRTEESVEQVVVNPEPVVLVENNETDFNETEYGYESLEREAPTRADQAALGGMGDYFEHSGFGPFSLSNETDETDFNETSSQE